MVVQDTVKTAWEPAEFEAALREAGRTVSTYFGHRKLDEATATCWFGLQRFR